VAAPSGPRYPRAVNPGRSISAVLLGVVLAASACGRYGTEYAAVIDGRTITFAALERAAHSASPAALTIDVERQALLKLIGRALVDEQLAKEGIVISEADVQAQLARVRASYPTPQAFEQALQQAGLNDVTIADQIRDQMSAAALQQRSGAVTVTDADVAHAYAADIGTYTQVHARHILFSTQSRGDAAALALARATLAQLRAGADFAATAKRLSDDAGSKASGGDLGTGAVSQYIPEFAKAIETAPVGVVIGPVKTQFGYHLVLVVSRTVSPLSAVRAQIRASLEQQRGQAALQTYFDKLVRSADIEVNPRIGDLDLKTLSIVDHRFFIPSSPEPSAAPIVGLPPLG
jgi:foldase protein PrsA